MQLTLFAEYLIRENDFKNALEYNGQKWKNRTNPKKKSSGLKHIVFLGFVKGEKNKIYFFQTTSNPKGKDQKILLISKKKSKKSNVYIDFSKFYKYDYTKFEKLESAHEERYEKIYKHFILKSLKIDQLRTLVKTTILNIYKEELITREKIKA